MTDARFYIYNVGHGVSTLLMGFKESDGSPYCGIFDCGSKGANYKCELGKVIDDMVGKIQAVRAEYIDDVVISHQDKDHWNMFLDLFFKLNGFEDYYDVAFGKYGELAWLLENDNILYTIWDGAFMRVCSAREYKYTAALAFGDDITKVLNFEVSIYISKRRYEISILVCETEGYIDITIDEKRTRREIAGGTVINVEYLVDRIIIPLIGRITFNLQLALDNLKLSFSNDNIELLYSKFYDHQNFKEITFPLRRVTSGGDMPGDRYETFLIFLQQLVKAYNNVETDDKHFIRKRYGAYISMTEDIDQTDSEDIMFPNCFTDLAPNKSNPAIIRNLSSVVLQFNIDVNNVLVLPGDVTAHAFERIASCIDYHIPGGALKLFLAPHHGSDHTNFLDVTKEPINQLIEAILENNRECSFVISGYNRNDDHPGQKFTEEVVSCLKDGSTPYHYAWAKNGAPCIVDCDESVDISRGKNKWLYIYNSNKRIYTTNLLNREYYILEDDGIKKDVIIGTASASNAKRRIPVDDSFI